MALRTHSLALVCTALALQASSSPQDLRLQDLTDPLLRLEVANTGGYPELLRPMGPTPLFELPVRSHSSGHVEFATDDLRIRLERFPTDRAQRRYGPGRRPAMAGDPQSLDQRLARLEVVVDGLVLAPPLDAVIDVFDPHFCVPHHDRFIRFATAVRSADGWRILVQVLAGNGPEARLVTWVFENDRYLFRVEDPFPAFGGTLEGARAARR